MSTKLTTFKEQSSYRETKQGFPHAKGINLRPNKLKTTITTWESKDACSNIFETTW